MSENHDPASDEYYDLGTHSLPIATTSTQAQIWFDRGLVWSYGFNHEEAISCFNKAISAEPSCAMAYWGLAYSMGPNYNKPWEFYDEVELSKTVQKAHEATAKAKELAVIPMEKALVEALQHRYPADHEKHDFVKWNQNYAEAMEKVHDEFGNDLDITTLYADALMNLSPWSLWDLNTGLPTPNSPTLKIRAILETALSKPAAFTHPGLLHLYIHLMEMSLTPEAALPSANALRNLVPDSGHLCHMPSHIDILCGDYASTITSNSSAILADEKFVSRNGAENFYTLYRAHNLHFRIYAAMFAGRSKVALDTVTLLEKAISEDLLRVKTPPMADWLEGFVSVRVHVLIRFGRWEELIALPIPQDQELYSVTRAMTHYGKGVAYAATGNVEEAEREREMFKEACGNVPESRTLFNNKCIDILAIASSMLDGELDYRRGDFSNAFEHLEKAIHLDDHLPYDEPWGWMQPTRHAYGALLLEQGRVEDAEKVYAADLGYNQTLPRALRHPGNVWALRGYHECLVKLGRKEEAVKGKEELEVASKDADVEVEFSCFCRRGEKARGLDSFLDINN